MKVTKLFKHFFESEKAGGFTLIICTIVSLFLANSFLSESYLHFWHTQFSEHSLEHWVNDGLMTIFFLLIGLELERELYKGELSTVRNALLPLSAAIGGMLVPAGLYMFLNYGEDTQSGFGIPMATDIAFALGILSLLGNRVPLSLKVFLTALAVIDDLGAILIIAIFYTKSLIWTNLIISLSIFALLCVFNRIKVRNLIPYLIGGVFMWYFMLNSGVHATITGVLLAFAIPFGNGNKKSTSYILQHSLHYPVAFIILPLFALANTAIVINTDWHQALTHHYTLGIALGLIVGKPVGIFLFTYLSTKFKICSLPEDLNWKSIFGVSFMGGIGFTMSIFITLLAFSDVEHIDNSKIMILVSSLVAGLIGFLYLKFVLKKENN
ncbi:Na+/H+ antiporter NhaA [Flavobacterium aquatile]|uniref:Na(+)/H(+) antiporter NhaA n=1 Tax=Flavobacterium aquatile LMG 4008 = ATCC 11947 TaxID=1453498 RepID=A0A095UYM5_9FLAO|nr:Na+/H+ antiporter NhaA [Flavobacterium aquatile]KGD67655.1 pH-dependent sodium/proton antiporter [Flavobacterium aquatile LMG 4008 = ATCC 11947]OXA67522.1 Na+/H+ antiporter NhaA [Flavobacterium aquatile] [Flavobacterium aquatile LMG 4008 = ATCC 11947]GEC79142.1 Na(+)/H(+) antiporter NhaA [Flavobacterium aquatile]